MTVSTQARSGKSAAIPVPQNVQDRDLRDCLAELPDPSEYVFCMPDWMVAALCRAELRGLSRILSREDAAILRPFGLVDYASRFLTGFGAAIYRALLEEHA